MLYSKSDEKLEDIFVLLNNIGMNNTQGFISQLGNGSTL